MRIVRFTDRNTMPEVKQKKPSIVEIVHLSDGVFIEKYSDGSEVAKEPDWDVRLRTIKVILSFMDNERRDKIIKLLKFEDKQIAGDLQLCLEQVAKDFSRRGAKKQRWSILKRDNFTCRYCGRKSPDVELHVDHIVPVVKGGGCEKENLATSCVDCNMGKGADAD